MTLVEFLRARYDEQEAKTQSLMRVAQDTQVTFEGHLRFLGRDVPGWWAWPDVEALCTQALADIAGKRAILKAYELTDEATDDYEWRGWEGALELLAEQFSDHHDYRTEWGATP